jgi:hypothetical protein
MQDMRKIGLIYIFVFTLAFLPSCSKSPEAKVRGIVGQYQKRYVQWMKGESPWKISPAFFGTDEMLQSKELDVFGDIDRTQRPELLAYLCAQQLQKEPGFTTDLLWKYITTQNEENINRIWATRWQPELTNDSPDILFPYLVLGYLGSPSVDLLLDDLQKNVNQRNNALISCNKHGLYAAGGKSLPIIASMINDKNTPDNLKLRLIDTTRNLSGLESPQIISPYPPNENDKINLTATLLQLFTNRRDKIGNASAQALAHGNFPIDSHVLIDLLTDAEEPYLIKNGIYILMYHFPEPDDPKITQLAEPFGRWLSNDETFDAAGWFLRAFPCKGEILEPFIVPAYGAILNRALYDSNREWKINSLEFLLKNFNFEWDGIWLREDIENIAAAFSESSSLTEKGYYLALLNAHASHAEFDLATITDEINTAAEQVKSNAQDPGAKMLADAIEAALEVISVSG